MKKLLFFLILFCGIVAVSESCKKNNDVESSNIESSINSEIEEVEEIEFPDEQDIDDTDYSSEATTKVLSVTSTSVAVATEDSGNGCETFKYTGYNRINGEEGCRFIVTLSQTDTLIDSVSTNKPTLVLAGYAPLTRISPTTYQFYAYQANGWDSLRNLKVQFIFKNNKGKTIKSKSIPCIGQNSMDESTFGTSGWGIDYFEHAINGVTYGLAGHITNFSNIDTGYIPQRGDIIRMSNGTKYKFGVITSQPVLVQPTRTKPKRWDFRLSEMNSRDCKSSITHKKIKAYAVSNNIATNIKSVDNTYSAVDFRRLQP